MTKAAAASRRKSGAATPAGAAAAAPPPPSDPPPPKTLASARTYIGRRVEKVFMDEAAGKYRPYDGEVTDVMMSATRPDGAVDNRIFFFVR